MNEFQRMRQQAEKIKETYPPGTRIELISMEDSLAPVPSGTRGTVKIVDDMGQIHMHWDNGRSLAIVPSADLFRKLTQEEIIEEQQQSEDMTDNNINPVIGM